MKKREINIGLGLILALAIIIISISIYQGIKEPEEIIEEPIIEEESLTREIVIEEPEEIIELPKEVIIQIYRFEFDKPEVVIETGTKVIWNNTDSRRHMITNKRIGLFRQMIVSLDQGESFEYIFEEPGTYEILEANFGINGKIIVEDNSNSITGYVIHSMEVSGVGFLLFALNMFGITAVALVAGFYFSRHKKPRY